MRVQNQTNFKLTNLTTFEDFFNENYHTACLVALRYLKNQQEAEDVVQETFLYLWERRSQLQIQQNLKHYLLQAVKNRSINFLARERKFQELNHNELEIIPANDADETFDKEELAVLISKSIDKLPAQCKKIFLLAYVDNLTYKQIAEALNFSKNTIKTQMGIAYKQLRQSLRPHF
jgi:RNA polymerase sigma-70 factor (ECF subfamily)